MNKKLIRVTIMALGLGLAAQASAKSGDIKVEGILSSLTPTEISVSGVTFQITADTEFENSADAAISPSAFSTGDKVEVKGIRVGDALVAREVELERDLTPPNGSSSSANGQSSSSSSSSGKGNKGGKSGEHREVHTKLKARFAAPAGVDTLAHGKARYESSTKHPKERFRINLEIPTPSTVPAIAAPTDELALEAVLSRAGVEYAICQFTKDDDSDDDDDNDSNEVEFKVDIKKRGTDSVISKKGSCDTDLTTDGSQNGLPAVQSGDTISVRSAGTVFLTGTF